jgi:hypothetical protein
MLDETSVNRIMGYGKKIQLLEGVYTKDEGEHKAGDEKIITIHFTPNSLKELPELFKKLDSYFQASGKLLEIEFQEQAAEIIKMATKKMHPDFNNARIIELFGLDGLAEAIEMVVNINDFFTKMTSIADKMSGSVKKVSEIQKEMKK